MEAKYEIKIIITDNDGDISLNVATELTGRPSDTFASLLYVFKKQIENAVEGQLNIAAEVAKLTEIVNNCTCHDDEWAEDED